MVGAITLAIARLAHESLFVRVGFGMLARGVDVDEIVRKTGVSRRGAPRRDPRSTPPRRRRRRRVASAARRRGPFFTCRDQDFAAPEQRIEQGRDRATPCAGDFIGARSRVERERVDQQRRVGALEKRRRSRREYDRIGLDRLRTSLPRPRASARPRPSPRPRETPPPGRPTPKTSTRSRRRRGRGAVAAHRRPRLRHIGLANSAFRFPARFPPSPSNANLTGFWHGCKYVYEFGAGRDAKARIREARHHEHGYFPR